MTFEQFSGLLFSIIEEACCVRSFGFFDVQKEWTPSGSVSGNAHPKQQPVTRVPESAPLFSLTHG
jgi:hypothetical protein